MRAQDRWFWSVLVGVILILIGVGVWMALRASSSPSKYLTYLPDESRPEVVVHNAYVAARRGDVDRFLSYFLPSVWPERERIQTVVVQVGNEGELTIGPAKIEGDRAEVLVEFVRAKSWGVFGVDFWIARETVVLRRQDGRWYITTTLPFVSIMFQPIREVPVPGN